MLSVCAAKLKLEITPAARELFDGAASSGLTWTKGAMVKLRHEEGMERKDIGKG